MLIMKTGPEGFLIETSDNALVPSLDARRAISDRRNESRSDEQPKWTWDCQAKLDFDGGTPIQVSSRFYPPEPYFETTTWCGHVSLWDGNDHTELRAFSNADLESLMIEVEAFTDDFLCKATENLKSFAATMQAAS